MRDLGAYLRVMRNLRSYLAIALSLVMVLTAHSASAMMGMRDATGQMVICTGEGKQTVYIDAEGQPTAPPHDCPDCVMLVLDAGAPPAGLLSEQSGSGGDPVVGDTVALADLLRRRAVARGPPVLV